MSADDIYADYLFYKACRQGGIENIDGVIFALTHEDLPRDEWEPMTMLGRMSFADRYTPRIAFPWSTPRERAVLDLRGDFVEVRRGDTLTIGHVRPMGVRTDHGGLDRPHHTQRRWASIVVRRANGKTTAVPQAWGFRGIADVMTPIADANYDQAKNALHARLVMATGLESIDDISLATERVDWVELLREAPELYRHAADALWHAERELDEGAAMVFGYLIGRAESQELVLPFAQRRFEVGEQLRRNASKPRRPGDLTRRAALAVIAKNPRILRRICADKVATARNLSDLKSVERTIAKLFCKEGDGRWRPDPAAVAAERRRLGEGG